MNHLIAIIPSNTANEYYWDMTNNCIQTLLNTVTEHIDIIVVESNHNANPLPNCHHIKLDGKFNYNKSINYGWEYFLDNIRTNNSKVYVGIFNNDVVFHPDWFAVAVSKADVWDSCSFVSPNWIHHKDVTQDVYGWGIGHEFCGWCVMMHLKVANYLMPLDEQFEFWCQDNDMAIQLSSNGYKHLLIHDAQITHLFSKSHNLVEDMEHATAGMVKRLKNKYK